MKQHNYYIYILTTTNNKVMYVGMTNDLERRLYEHQNKLIDGFTQKYNLTKLVYFENTTDVNSAIQREKEIKKWRREKKNNLVGTTNPNWNDLSDLVFPKISQSTDEAGLIRNDECKISGLIITAGLSSRMGEYKPLLKYEGNSFLQNIVAKLSSVCDETVVITGHNSDLIESELKTFRNQARTVFNDNYNNGMFTSLQKGLENIENSDWVLYHFVDQPSIPNDFYTNFVNEIDNPFDWIQPKYKEKKGHPILINKRLINLITKAQSTSNLKAITAISIVKKKYWNCDYSEILDDIDTIERYNKLNQ